jgi:hypothetical protein
MSNGRARFTSHHLVKSQPSGVTQREWQDVFLGKESGEMRRHLATANTFNTYDSNVEGADSKLTAPFLSQVRKWSDKHLCMRNHLKVVRETGLYTALNLSTFLYSEVIDFPRQSYYEISQLRSALKSKLTQIYASVLGSEVRFGPETPLKNLTCMPYQGNSSTNRIISVSSTENNLDLSQNFGGMNGIEDYQNQRDRNLQSALRSQAILVQGG